MGEAGNGVPGQSSSRGPCSSPVVPPSSGDGTGQPSPPSKPGRPKWRVAEKWVGDFTLSQPVQREDPSSPSGRTRAWLSGRTASLCLVAAVAGGVLRARGRGHGLWCPG